MKTATLISPTQQRAQTIVVTNIGLAILLLAAFLIWKANGAKGPAGQAVEPAPEQLVPPSPPGSTDPVTGVTAFKPTVVMISSDRCGWCDKFERDDKPKLSEDYDVQVRKDIPAESYPRFSIFDGQQWTHRIGYVSFDKFPRLTRSSEGAPDSLDDAVQQVTPYAATIVVFLSDACPDSRFWYEAESGKYFKEKWHVRCVWVDECPDEPQFRIYFRGRWHPWSGYLRTSDVQDLLDRN